MAAALALQRVARGWGMGRVHVHALRADQARREARAVAIKLARQRALAAPSAVGRARAAWRKGMRKLRATFQLGHFDELSDESGPDASDEEAEARARAQVPEIRAAKEAARAAREATGDPATPPHVRAAVAALQRLTVTDDDDDVGAGGDGSGAIAGAGAGAGAGAPVEMDAASDTSSVDLVVQHQPWVPDAEELAERLEKRLTVRRRRGSETPACVCTVMHGELTLCALPCPATCVVCAGRWA